MIAGCSGTQEQWNRHATPRNCSEHSDSESGQAAASTRKLSRLKCPNNSGKLSTHPTEPVQASPGNYWTPRNCQASYVTSKRCWIGIVLPNHGNVMWTYGTSLLLGVCESSEVDGETSLFIVDLQRAVVLSCNSSQCFGSLQQLLSTLLLVGLCIGS